MNVRVDINLSPVWVAFLGEAGISAIHWSSIGHANAPDAEIMSFATSNELIVPTRDLDCGAILAVIHGEKPSVVQIRADHCKPEAIGAPLLAALRQMASDTGQSVD